MELFLEGVYLAVNQAHRDTGVDAVRMHPRTLRAVTRAALDYEMSSRRPFSVLTDPGSTPARVFGTRVIVDRYAPEGVILPLFEPLGEPAEGPFNTSPIVDPWDRHRWDRSWADYEPARPTVDSHVVQASTMAEEELTAWAEFTQELRDRAARRRGPG